MSLTRTILYKKRFHCVEDIARHYRENPGLSIGKLFTALTHPYSYFYFYPQLDEDLYIGLCYKDGDIYCVTEVLISIDDPVHVRNLIPQLRNMIESYSPIYDIIRLCEFIEL